MSGRAYQAGVDVKVEAADQHGAGQGYFAAQLPEGMDWRQRRINPAPHHGLDVPGGQAPLPEDFADGLLPGVFRIGQQFDQVSGRQVAQVLA